MTDAPEEIRTKHVLLDTNVLIDSAKYPEDFDSFFKFLDSYSVISVLEQTIKFEFLRGFQTKKELEKAEKFLEKLFGKNRLELNPDTQTFNDALNIALLAYRSGNKVIKLGDCLIAAQIKKYSNTARLYLATQNHRDFPPFLFQCVHVHLVTLNDGSIKPIGLYRFDMETYNKISV